MIRTVAGTAMGTGLVDLDQEQHCPRSAQPKHPHKHRKKWGRRNKRVWSGLQARPAGYTRAKTTGAPYETHAAAAAALRYWRI